MYGLILGVHLLVCFGLVAVVLVQSGKGGGLAGGAFGGTAQTVFGGRGATDFITRATMVLGGAFFLTSLLLALLSTNAARSRSLIQEQARRAAPAGSAPARTQSGGTQGGSQSLTPGSQAPAPATGTAPAPAGSGTAPAPATPPTGGGSSKPPGGGN